MAKKESSIEITEIKVRPFEKEGSKIVAFVDITINGAIAIRNVKIIDGEKGLFLGMPSTKNKNNEYTDIVFPINQETRDYITDFVLAEFKKVAKDEKLF